jgi:serine/threonine protein kinase
MAPEQARGGRVGAAADVWGIGVVLWEAACGETPLADESVEYPQLVHRAAPLRSRRRLPAALANGVDRCLEPDAAARPTVDELRAALEPVAGARG